MILNYFWVIHITIEKIIIGNTQPAHGDLGTSPKDPNVKPTREITRDPQSTLSWTIQKLMILWKNCFSEVIGLVLLTWFCFLQEEQIFKSLKRDVDGTSTGLSCWASMGPNDGTFEGLLWNVGPTWFLNQTHKHIKLTLMVVAKNSVNSTVVKKII